MSRILFSFLFFSSVLCCIQSQTWDELMVQARDAYLAGDYNTAAQRGKLALDIIDRDYPGDLQRKGSNLNVLSVALVGLGKYDEATPYLEESLRVIEEVFGREHGNYATTLNNLGSIYKLQGNYDKAISLFEESLELAEKSAGKENNAYVQKLLNLHTVCIQKGDFKRSVSLLLEAEDLLSKFADTSNVQYIYLNNGFSEYYRVMGDYPRALPYAEIAYEKALTILGEKHAELGLFMNDLTYLHIALGNYDVAAVWSRKAVEHRKEILGTSHPEYLTTLSNLAEVEMKRGNYTESFALYTELLSQSRQVFGVTHPYHAIFLNNLARFYWEIGDYEKAAPLLEEALAITEENYGRDHHEYATSLSNLAFNQSKLGLFEEALANFDRAAACFENTLGTKHAYYANILNNRARTYRFYGNENLAEKNYFQALEILDEVYGKQHPGKAVILNNLANINLNRQDFDEAFKLLQQADSLLLNELGVDHPKYGVQLELWIRYYMATEQWEKGIAKAMDSRQHLEHRIKYQFSFLSEREKERYLHSLKERISTYYALASKTANDYPEMAALAYDLALLLKGLVLETSFRLSEFQQTGEVGDQKNLQDWLILRTYLANTYQVSSEERNPYVDSLQMEAEALERKLAKASPVLDAYLKERFISWEDVKKHLAKDEVALEFLRYQAFDNVLTNSWKYGVLLIDTERSHPVFVELGSERDLELLVSNQGLRRLDYVDQLYTFADRGGVVVNKETPSLYEVSWGPLEDFLVDKARVYLSPAGFYHRLNIEAIPYDKDYVMGQRLDVHLLGSTGQLIHAEVPVSTESAALFGGLEYQFPDSLLGSLPEEIGTDSNEVVLTSLTLPSNKFRGDAWEFLKYSQAETEQLHILFQEQGFEVDLLEGMRGSEENFKMLAKGSESPDILHISTHGFFFPDATESADLLADDRSSSFSLVENPMLRSGLILSGANYAWTGNTLSTGMEDGILTAYEIEQLDLSGTDIVVLSACETGLGDIRGNEGVFGLQRAFRKAGVDNILMSLWQVPDYQTQELMVLFYKNMLAHSQDVHKALKNAQLALKEKYRNPYFWAGFILLE